MPAVPLLGALLSFSGSSSDPMDITLVHWNPHWQCFVGQPACAANASRALDGLLTPDVDFANVVEYELSSYTPPAGWAALAANESCGRDWDTLFFNAKRWAPVGMPKSGCVVEGRSFAGATFASVLSPGFGRLTVVGAHFPQTQHAVADYTAATETLGTLYKALGADGTARAVLLADTNTESPSAAAALPWHNTSGGVNRTNAALMADLGLWKLRTEPPAAPLFQGCCATPDPDDPHDTPFSWQGDRIVANFGQVAAFRTLFDPAPAWALFNGSEFHKGISLTLRA